MTNDNEKESVNLLNQEGLSKLMEAVHKTDMKETSQTGIDLMLLGIMTLRANGVYEQDILASVEKQIPLADMVLEVITGQAVSGA